MKLLIVYDEETEVTEINVDFNVQKLYETFVHIMETNEEFKDAVIQAARYYGDTNLQIGLS